MASSLILAETTTIPSVSEVTIPTEGTITRMGTGKTMTLMIRMVTMVLIPRCYHRLEAMVVSS